MRAARLALMLAACISGKAFAQSAMLLSPDTLAGDWLLTLAPGEAIHTGVLQIEASADGVAAFVDGGPVSVTIDGYRLQLDIDTRDGGGRLLAYRLEGRLAGGALNGMLQPPLDAPAGSWHAERLAAHTEGPPQAVDFSGIWSRTSSGIAKVHLD